MQPKGYKVKYRWVLFDDEGTPIRYFDWAYPYAVKEKIHVPVQPVIDWDNFEEAPF